MQSHDNLTTPYKLLNWIQKDKLNYDNLSLNHKAVHLLEQNPDKINWKKKLSKLPNIPTTIIANEFFDAFPVEQYIFKKSK